MYAIISRGVLVALCDRPRYIKVNEKTGAYIEASEVEAIGVAVGGDVYNLNGGTAIKDAPEAVIRPNDVAEYVFRNSVKISENEEATNAGFAEVEDAVCEFETTADERMSAMEDALCELDTLINGGGEI